MHTATDIVVPRMLALQRLVKMLKKLDLNWKVIETTARVVSPPESAGFIGNLQHTRQAFSQLSAEMVEQIAATHLANCQRDLASRAQVAIDILVRNLFERTADIGFIATDAPLVSFALAPSEAGRASLHARLAEYRAKYTVYDDILLLDDRARVLLSLKPRAAAVAEPAWWSQALANQGHVEAYGPSTLFGTEGPVLLYASAVAAPAQGVCGVVVLKFDLQSEIDSIFHALAHHHVAIVLLDAQSRVLASSAPGTFVQADSLSAVVAGQGAGNGLLQHQGVDYLYAHCDTRGYQGYRGPGWTAVALVRVDDAFAQPAASPASQPMHGARGDNEIELDNPQLHRIVGRAKDIEKDLNRVIWNGKISEFDTRLGSALGPVFAEIDHTSRQTIAVFDGAIRELKHLLMLGKRAELVSHARLAVDIMDRNLYERANDCRWWALSEEFAQLLEVLEAGPSAQATRKAADILAHLNSLYTVYRRVALFDRHGRVLAVSRDNDTLQGNADIPSALLQQTLSLRGTQAYAVSHMQPHALADGAATYLYCAPIRKSSSAHVLGGIALAFNCADELQAMLRDALPVGAGATSGFFVDADGRVLSSTDGAVAVGDVPAWAAALAPSRYADGTLPIQLWNGQPHLVGLARSHGYREFKVSDGYQDEVRAVLMAPVALSAPTDKGRVLPQVRTTSPADVHNYGVVQCGHMLLALEDAHVVEAVSADQMRPPAVGSDGAGLLHYRSGAQVLVLPVYDTCKLIALPAIADPENAVVVIVRKGQSMVALLVDRLIDVVQSDHVAPPPGGVNPGRPWLSGFIHDHNADSEPVFTVDTHAMALRWTEVAL